VSPKGNDVHTGNLDSFRGKESVGFVFLSARYGLPSRLYKSEGSAVLRKHHGVTTVSKPERCRVPGAGFLSSATTDAE
jgi:hypothetical protein